MVIRNRRTLGHPGLRTSLVALLLAGACGPSIEDEYDEDPFLEGDGAGTASYGNTTANRAAWRSLSQYDRNNRILDRASRDLDRHVGLNCKQWVRRVVADASNGVVEIPSTYPTETGWQWYQGTGVAGMSANIRNAKVGWIVQMNIRDGSGGSTPHTAIVAGVSADGINWIDSNFVGANRVGTHFQTFADFERDTFIGGRQRYSVFTVVGTY